MTPFTFTLAIYPMLAVDYLSRRRPWLRAALLSMGLTLLVVVHVTIETPSDLYRTWSQGASTSDANPGISNLLGIESALMGVVSNSVLGLLFAALIWAIVRVVNRKGLSPKD